MKIKTTKSIVFPSPSLATKETITSQEVRCTWHYVKPRYAKNIQDFEGQIKKSALSITSHPKFKEFANESARSKRSSF